MDPPEEKSTADEESSKSNKERSPTNVESKDGVDEATKRIEYLKIETTDTEVTAAPSDVSSLAATPANSTPANTPTNAAIDIAEVAKKWSPEAIRDAPAREDDPKYLPYDGEKNPLCGGDFVFTISHATSAESKPTVDTATIAFLFCHDGKNYGMTVGHLCPSVGTGSTLFAYAKGEDGAVKIGHVVAFSLSVDSLIFRLDDDIKADLYKVRLADDTKHAVDLSRAEAAMNNLRAHCVSKTNKSYQLIGRGAQRRGTEGVFSSFWKEKETPNIHENDVGMCWNGAPTGDGSDYSQKDITAEGDCGMIIFDANGDPLSMFHGHFETSGKPVYYESYSVPLTRIIKEHRSFFPNIAVSEIDDDSSIQQTSPQKRASRPVPQIGASFVAKHRLIIKMKPGVLRLARIPGSGLTPSQFLERQQHKEDSQC